MPQITARIRQDSEGDESPFEKDVYSIITMNEDTIADIKDTLCSMAIRTPIYRENLTIMHGDMRFEDDIFVGDILSTMEILLCNPPDLTVKYESSSTADFLSGLPSSLTLRMLVCIDSNVPRLQNENALFEINSQTLVTAFTQMVIARMDEFSVMRTFPEQILFQYGDITVIQACGSQKLQEALKVSRSWSSSPGKVLHLKLLVEEAIGRSIFSRDFLDELRSNDRLTFLPSNIDSEEEVSEINEPNTEHVPRDISYVPISPMKVVVSADGPEYTLSGQQLELIETNRDKGLLAFWVNPADLALAEIQIKVEHNNLSTLVSLSTLQCIIVDNGSRHKPYMLLSPSGAAKMCMLLRDSSIDETLLQQVEIHLLDEHTSIENQTRNVHPRFRVNLSNLLMALIRAALVAAARHVYHFVRALIRVFPLTSFLKFGLMLQFFNFGIPQMSSSQWRKVAFFAFAAALAYVVFGIGSQVATQIESFVNRDGVIDAQNLSLARRALLQLANVLRFIDNGANLLAHGVITELIRIGVSRRPAYEYLVEYQELQRREIRVWWQIKDNFDDIWKSILLAILTNVPSWNTKVNEQVEIWRSGQLNELEHKVVIYQDLIAELAKQYDRQFTPSFAVAAAMDPTFQSFPRLVSGESSADQADVTEKYIDLVTRMHSMRRIQKALNISLMSHTPHEPTHY